MQLGSLSKHSFLGPTTKLTPTVLPRMPYPASIIWNSTRERPEATFLPLDIYLSTWTITLTLSICLWTGNTLNVGRVSLILAFAHTWWQVARAQVNKNNSRKAKPKVRARGATRPPLRTACHGDCLTSFRVKYLPLLKGPTSPVYYRTEYDILQAGNYRTVSSKIYQR